MNIKNKHFEKEWNYQKLIEKKKINSLKKFLFKKKKYIINIIINRSTLTHYKRFYTIPTTNNLNNTYDYAFEMATSNIRYYILLKIFKNLFIRFGFGVTKEVGLDMKNWKAKNVCIFAGIYFINEIKIINIFRSFINENFQFMYKYCNRSIIFFYY